MITRERGDTEDLTTSPSYDWSLIFLFCSVRTDSFHHGLDIYISIKKSSQGWGNA
jgi:hypothetical protein